MNSNNYIYYYYYYYYWWLNSNFLYILRELLITNCFQFLQMTFIILIIYLILLFTYIYKIKNTVHEVLNFLGLISPKITQKTVNGTDVGRY